MLHRDVAEDAAFGIVILANLARPVLASRWRRCGHGHSSPEKVAAATGDAVKARGLECVQRRHVVGAHHRHQELRRACGTHGSRERTKHCGPDTAAAMAGVDGDRHGADIAWMSTRTWPTGSPCCFRNPEPGTFLVVNDAAEPSPVLLGRDRASADAEKRTASGSLRHASSDAESSVPCCAQRDLRDTVRAGTQRTRSSHCEHLVRDHVIAPHAGRRPGRARQPGYRNRGASPRDPRG